MGNLNNENIDMLLNMSRTKTIPATLKRLTDELDKLSAHTSKTEARQIFEHVDEYYQNLQADITQMKSFFKDDAN